MIKKWILLAAALLVFSGCSNQAKPEQSKEAEATIAPPAQTQQTETPKPATVAQPETPKSATVAQPTVTPPAALNEKSVGTYPKIDHIVVVVEENHSRKKIAGNPDAPYMNSLMQSGANFANMYAIEHPSQPNYLDLFSGSNQGVKDDKMPKEMFATPNLASELLEKKLTFGGYSEDLPSVGYTGASYTADGKSYARKHSPWVSFSNVPKELNMPFTSFPKDDFSKLPTVSFVIPNLDNDMHDGTIAQADKWLKEKIDPYVEWAKTHNSLLIVTWDEDDKSENNRIPTMFVGPMVKPAEYSEKYDLFSILRTIEDIYGLSHAGKSETAAPVSNIWK